MIKSLLLSTTLLTLVFSMKLTVLLNGLEKHCFYEILCNYSLTQRSIKNIPLTPYPNRPTSTKSKSITCSMANGKPHTSKPPKHPTNPLTSTNSHQPPQLTPSVSKTPKDNKWNSALTSSQASNFFSLNCFLTKMTLKTLTENSTGSKTRKETCSVFWKEWRAWEHRLRDWLSWWASRWSGLQLSDCSQSLWSTSCFTRNWRRLLRKENWSDGIDFKCIEYFCLRLNLN